MKPRKTKRAKKPVIMPSIIDDALKGRCKGYVYDLSLTGDQTVIAVYGSTMEEMRRLKHHLTACIREFYEGQNEPPEIYR